VKRFEDIVIVGGSLAGLRAAETFRSEGYRGALTLVGAEDRPPYDRPPLSKEILRGTWEPDRIALQRAGAPQLDCDFRLGQAATSLDLDAKQVLLADGATISFDGLVLATGARARRFPSQPSLDGLFTLRTVEDSLAIRDALRQGAPRVAVVGAGFIGAEVAASCRGMGLDVTMVEVADRPMSRLLPPELGAISAQMHRDQGVELRLGVGIDGFSGTDRVEGLRLADGSEIPADVVIVGVGAEPVVDWLEGCGLELSNGVVCDERLFAAPDVVAAGDCARWMSKRSAGLKRLEHWTNAVDQGVAAAKALLAGDRAEAYDPVPYVWSDQYGVKIQIVGEPAAEDCVHFVHGQPGDLRFVALLERDGQFRGAVGFRRPRFMMEYLGLLEAGCSIEEALEKSESL
jgi:NADPH-dependent 2,4-dienoyl-CoA reductase/sulfur reductase-like enzyme